MKEKRTKSVKIRLLDSEFEQLQQMKECSELATWMRETCLNKKVKRRNPPPVVDPLLLRQLAALGNNVNQIARQCNSKLEPTDALEVLVRLDAIETFLKKVRDDHASKISQ